MSRALKDNVIRIFLYCGYVSLILQSAWTVVLYSSWVLESGLIERYVQSSGTPSKAQVIDVTLPEFIRQPLGAVVVAFAVFLTLFFLFRTPPKATQVTIRAVESSVHTVTPQLEKALHIPKRKRKKTQKHVIFGIQVITSLVVFALTALISTAVSGLSSSAILAVGGTLCITSLLLFVIRFVLEHMWGTSHSRSQQ